MYLLYDRKFELYLNETKLSFRNLSVDIDNAVDVVSKLKDSATPLRHMKRLEIVVHGPFVGCPHCELEQLGEGGDPAPCKLCYMRIKDGVNNLAHLLSQWPELSDLTVAFVDNSNLKKVEDLDEYELQMIWLAQPLNQVRGLKCAKLMVSFGEHGECTRSSEDSPGRLEDPAVQKSCRLKGYSLLSEIVSNMISNKPKHERKDRPVAKEAFKRAIWRFASGRLRTSSDFMKAMLKRQDQYIGRTEYWSDDDYSDWEYRKARHSCRHMVCEEYGVNQDWKLIFAEYNCWRACEDGDVDAMRKYAGILEKEYDGQTKMLNESYADVAAIFEGAK